MNDFYLEYSPIQKAFHIAQIGSIKEDNRSLISRNENTSYLIISGPGTHEEMSKERIKFENEFGRP